VRKRILGKLVCCVFSVAMLLSIEIVSILVRNTSRSLAGIYRVFQSIIQELIPELILSRKRHIQGGPIRNDSEVMIF
jgi:hypothetical protein